MIEVEKIFFLGTILHFIKENSGTSQIFRHSPKELELLWHGILTTRVLTFQMNFIMSQCKLCSLSLMVLISLTVTTAFSASALSATSNSCVVFNQPHCTYSAPQHTAQVLSTVPYPASGQQHQPSPAQGAYSSVIGGKHED